MQKLGWEKGFPAHANSFNTGTQIQRYFWTCLNAQRQIHLCPEFSWLCLTSNNSVSICLSTRLLENQLFHSYSTLHTVPSLDQHFPSFPLPTPAAPDGSSRPYWRATHTAPWEAEPSSIHSLTYTSCVGTLASLENNLCPKGSCGHCQWDHAAHFFTEPSAWRGREKQSCAIFIPTQKYEQFNLSLICTLPIATGLGFAFKPLRNVQCYAWPQMHK